MAEKWIHATLSPGQLKSLSETLTVSVDEPKNAKNVWLCLWESDSWYGGTTLVTEDKEPETAYNLIARFEGEIIDKKFKVDLFRQGYAPKANTHKLRVHIDGEPKDKVYLIEIPESTGEKEYGFLEITMSIGGETDGLIVSYENMNPVFVRNISNRPVIAFITDVDHPDGHNPYFKNADIFFRKITDNVKNKISYKIPRVDQNYALTEIFDILRDGSRPWGEINIVAHANGHYWGVRDKPGEKIGLILDGVKALNKSPRYPLLEPLPSTLVDDNTLVVLRGCMLGNNQDFLDEVAILFAGQVGKVIVLAPKYFQTYDNNGKEYLNEEFEFYLKGKQPTRPTLDKCRDEIRKDEKNKNKDLSEIKIFETYEEENKIDYIRDEFGTALDKATKNAEFEGWARHNDPDFPPEKEMFDWTVTKKEKNKSGELQSFILTGYRTLVVCTQILKTLVQTSDGKTKKVPVVPNLDNPDHYGRSPPW